MTRAAILVGLLLPALLVGCDDEDEISPEEAAPTIGALELPISHRNQGQAPSNAVMVEVAPAALGLDGRKVIDLDNGRVASSERSGSLITKLKTAIQSAPARRAAAVRMHVNTPYQTMALILGSLKEAGVSSVAFEVRGGPSAETGWLNIESFRVGPLGEEPIEFEGNAQRAWTDFADNWEAVYTGCRRANYVDCDYMPQVAAQDGKLQIKLWSRGAALKLEFVRFGGVDLDAQQPGTGPALIEGVQAPQPDEEIPPPPATQGTFTWRFEAATAELSPISDSMRPICGSRPCGVVVEADAEVLSLRLISFLGATFPNGTDAPQVYFVVPEWQD